MNALTIDVQEVISETVDLVANFRRSLVKVMCNLHILRENKEVWAEYETFPKFAEERLGLNQSMCSKLTKAYDGWVLKAGVSPELLEGIDYEKLYGYVPLLEGKDPELALAEVKNWNRSEIRAEKEEKAPCSHEIKPVCIHCWAVDPNNEANPA